MAREIRKEKDWLGNEKEVTYGNGVKDSETRHEKTFFGTPVDRTYDPDGNRTSETRHEKTFFGTPVDRTYDPEGNRTSETRHEKTFFGTPVDRTYDPEGNQVSETRRERTFWGTRVKRVYEKGTRPHEVGQPVSASSNHDSGGSSYDEVTSPRVPWGILILAGAAIAAWLMIEAHWDGRGQTEVSSSSSVSDGKEYPVCRQPRDLSLSVGNPKQTLALSQNCWSGWVTLPSSVSGFHIHTPGYIDFLFSDGRRVFLSNNAVQWPGQPPGRTFRLRGPGVATVVITRGLNCPPFQMCQVVDEFTLK